MATDGLHSWSVLDTFKPLVLLLFTFGSVGWVQEDYPVDALSSLYQLTPQLGSAYPLTAPSANLWSQATQRLCADHSALPGVGSLTNTPQLGGSESLLSALASLLTGLLQNAGAQGSGTGSLSDALQMSQSLGGAGKSGKGHKAKPKRMGGGGHSSDNSGAGASNGTSSTTPSVIPGKPGASGYLSPIENYRVTSGYGSRTSPTSGHADDHGGIDLAAPTGTPIRASKGGEVVVAQDLTTSYGKWIEIRHDDGSKTRYAHMSERLAQKGQRVEAGQVIGKVGSTGNSTGPHLHFEVFAPNGERINPATVLK